MKGSEWWADAPTDLNSDAWHDAVLDAVANGWLWWRWRELQIGPLTVRVMTEPLAIGTDEDHVHLYGMSAALMDKILLVWNAEHMIEPVNEIMTPTSLILDAFAADPRAVLVGPFTDKPGTKAAAKRHSDRLIKAQRGYMGRDCRWPEFKTYTLKPYRPGIPVRRDSKVGYYACEYGWHVERGGKPTATRFDYLNNGLRLHQFGDGLHRIFHGEVIQPEKYAHGYRFQDYSMAAWYMSAHGRLNATHVDLRELLADPERAHLVTVHGAQDWHIHPAAGR